jgi:hypothetical protein
MQTYQDPEPVQQLSGMGVDTARVLELSVLQQLVDHVHLDAVALLQVGQVLDLVAPQVGDDVLVIQKPADLARGLLQLVALQEDLVALLLVLVGHVVEAVDFLVQLADKVGHVGGLEQLEEELLLLDGLLGLFVAGEVEERVDEMAVEVGHELGEQRVLLGDGGAICRGVGHVGWLSLSRSRWMGEDAKFAMSAAVVGLSSSMEKRLCASETPATR